MKTILILILVCYAFAEDELDTNEKVASKLLPKLPTMTQTMEQVITNDTKPKLSESEPECNPAIPKRIRDIGFSPIVEVKTKYDSLFLCETGSRIKQISYQTVSESSKVTCNGVIVRRDDDFYDVIYATNKMDRLNITSYTQVSSYLNGNMDYIECGIISGGKCHGDTIWGTGIHQANILDGCRKQGNDGLIATYREIEIKGNCRSRCALGKSSIIYSQLVSDRGLPQTNIFESDEQVANFVFK